MKKPILITGINGFIGSHLAERLLKEGMQVRGIVRRPKAAKWLEEKGVEIVTGDLLDASTIKSAVEGCSIVVHAAVYNGGAAGSKELEWRTNVEGTTNVLAACKACDIERMVYISSIAVYGINTAPLLDEGMPTPPVGELYPDCKITAETSVRASHLPYVIVRPAYTYGPRGGAWTVSIVNQILQGSKLLGRDDGIITPGYIDNVIDGLFLTITKNAAIGCTFNICDDYTVTYREFFLAYARMLGLNSMPTTPQWIVTLKRSETGWWLRKRIRKMRGREQPGKWSSQFRFNPSQYSIEHAKDTLGYSPKVDFFEGLRRTEDWLRENNFLNS